MTLDRPPNAPLTQLLRAIDEARSMLGPLEPEVDDGPPAGSGITLLQQCLSLCDESSIGVEPVRTLHHLACTGGTAVAKCIAAMPNVQLLSEVDPLSPLVSAGQAPKFTPTDLTALLRWSTRTTDSETLIGLFQAQIGSLHDAMASRGQHLVLRDHAHSHFCTGPAVPERPSLRQIVQAVRPVVSALTVRNPFDSYASLMNTKWLHFEPSGFDEYCRRYHAFIDHYHDLPIFRYEDIVTDPQAQLQALCNALELRFVDAYDQTFSAFRLSGDSGRRGDVLQLRPRREAALRVAAQNADLPVARELLARLGYPQAA